MAWKLLKNSPAKERREMVKRKRWARHEAEEMEGSPLFSLGKVVILGRLEATERLVGTAGMVCAILLYTSG